MRPTPGQIASMRAYHRHAWLVEQILTLGAVAFAALVAAWIF